LSTRTIHCHTMAVSLLHTTWNFYTASTLSTRNIIWNWRHFWG
jgi:hypothetical protein